VACTRDNPRIVGLSRAQRAAASSIDERVTRYARDERERERERERTVGGERTTIVLSNASRPRFGDSRGERDA